MGSKVQLEALSYDEGAQGESAGWALFDSTTGQPLHRDGRPIVGTKRGMDKQADMARSAGVPATPVLVHGRANGADLAEQLCAVAELMAGEPSGVYRHAAQAVRLAASALLAEWTTLNAVQQAGEAHREFGSATPMRFVFRESGTGRGVRLHQVTASEASRLEARGEVTSESAREAVLASPASVAK